MRNMKLFAWLFFGLLMLTIIPMVDSVKADPPSPHPYDYIYAPSGNGFGHNYVKLVNTTFFKNMFQAHTKWMLEYKRYSYSSWTDGASYLSIQKTWSDSGFWKFSLTLNVPVNIYSARFTFGIDINCLQYVERSGTEIRVNYTANATETFSCMFNWSDLKNIPGLVITKGLSDSKMWFRFQKDTINAGNYVFDPFFGYDQQGYNDATIENTMASFFAQDYNTVSVNFVPKSITAFLSVTTKSHKVKCAIYRHSSKTLIASTVEVVVPVTTPLVGKWIVFNFSSNICVASGYFDLSIWSNSTTGDCKLWSEFTDPEGSSSSSYYKTVTYTGNYPNPRPNDDLQGFDLFSMYCTYDIYYMNCNNIYPVNNSYTHKNVTLSGSLSMLGKFNFSLYKKIGSAGYWLVETKTSQTNLTYFNRWFNATTTGTLYKWFISLKNYSFNVWKNYSFNFYINDSTVHLSDTKTNVAGTLTSLRNNTGFWITSIHNSSITKRDRTVNSSLVHVSYWVTNTWVDYVNSTGTTTPIAVTDTKTNVAGSCTYTLDGTGYHVTSIHNSSITPYNHEVNSTLVHQYYWVTNTWKDYVNSTGNVTAIHTSDTKKNVTGSLSYSLNGTGYWVASTHESRLSQFTNLINAHGTHTGAWNGASWVDYANITGNASSCNSTNLTLYENFVDAAGTHQSFYDPLLGWFAWANVTGNASMNITGNYTVGLNFTGFNGYIVWSGDHIENKTNISFLVTSNMSINGSVHVDEDAYFLAGMLSFDPAVMILSLFFGFFYIGYESKKRSGGFFMLFAGFLLIALGILVYGMLGYAAVLVVPFAIFIMLLGGKKAFYGPEAEEPQGNKPTK